jgi:hypothetical protein
MVISITRMFRAINEPINGLPHQICKRKWNVVGLGERVVRGAHRGGCWVMVKAGVRNQTRPTVRSCAEDVGTVRLEQ